MRQWGYRTWLALILAAGCGPVRPPYPDDPLLIGRHPVVGKIANSRPVRVASAEPAPPSVAPEALAHLPRRPDDVITANPAMRRGGNGSDEDKSE